MMQVSSLLFWGMAEALLLVFLLLLVLVGVLYYRHSRDQKAGKALIAQVKQAAEKRAAALTQSLSQAGYQGEALEAKLKQLRKAEMQFYRILLAVYLKRDATQLARMNQRLEQLLAPYLGLKGVPAGVPVGASEEESHEIEILRQENKELSDEMRITMDTLGRVLNEYASVFSEDELDRVESIDVGKDKAAMTAVDDLDAVFAEVDVSTDQENASLPHVDDELAEELVDEASSDMELEDLFDEADAAMHVAAPAARPAKTPKIEPQPDLDQDDLDALLDQTKGEMGGAGQAQAAAEELDEFDLDALFDEAASQVERMEQGVAAEVEQDELSQDDLSQDDLDNLFDQASAGHAGPSAADQDQDQDQGMDLDQDDLDALFDMASSGVKEPSGAGPTAKAEAPDPSMDLDADLDQDDLDALFNEALSGDLSAELDPDSANLDDDGFGQEDLDSLIDEALLEAGLQPDEVNGKMKG
jgi:hypothetical protein